MRPSILFLPAAIRSHIIPALSLAGLLEEKYDVWFAVSDDALENLVTANGYKACRSSHYRVAVGMEGRFVKEQKQKSGKWAVLGAIWGDDLWQYRMRELYDIIMRVKPRCLFVDVYNSTDLLAIFPLIRQTSVLFFNPMLSTFRVNGFPAIHENQWPTHANGQDASVPHANVIKKFFARPFKTLIDFSIQQQFTRLHSKDGFSSSHPVAPNLTQALLFENIPELILAPQELELSPEIRKAHQHYLGLCIREDRSDPELDQEFANRFRDIVCNMTSGCKLVYCSFGTFYNGPDSALLRFLNKLIDIVGEIPNIMAIFSVNKLIIETLKHQRVLASNLHFFSRVQQLQVLKQANLFVTHGGLGSIKEGIRYEVPMLVYPLDLLYDQNGNGLKVEYHGLGLKGDFHQEKKSDMKQKLTTLLQDVKYKNAIKAFHSKIQETYDRDTLRDFIHQQISGI